MVRWVLSCAMPLLIAIDKVSSSYDLFVKLWDVENDYKNIMTFRGHEHSVSSAGFMPGDAQVISSSRDASVRIWDISTGCVL